MAVLLTGAAGFIGATTAELLVAAGRRVIGVDRFTEDYDPRQKRESVAGLLGAPGFTLVEADLAHVDLDGLFEGIDSVVHLAARPGVRDSWDHFDGYTRQNLIVTQRLLEHASNAGVRRFVYASSSSVYGEARSYPCEESDPTVPHSPYGITKLAAELLCRTYAANVGLSTVSLRFFTVYGPRQRPDMAIHRLIEAALGGTAFPMFGTGDQVRDFTFVEDVARGTVAALDADVPAGSVFNLAGGSSASLAEVVELVGELCDTTIRIDHLPTSPGDVRRTGGTTTAARERLGWAPRIGLREGLERQVAWHRRRDRAERPA